MANVNKYYVYADRIILADEVLENAYLEIMDGKFGYASIEKPLLGEIIDYTGKTIAPGLVDTHIHGFHGADVMDNDFESVKTMSKGLVTTGVTSFLPTTLTSAADLLEEVAAKIGTRYQEVEGARILGIFFEGPWFTEEHKGAQNPAYMGDPDLKQFKKWQAASNGLIKKIAIAPERDGAVEFARMVTASGVQVALGHSSATYEEALEVVDAGASTFVHTYNGMSGLLHRAPGMVGAAMASDAYAEVICDGLHVHPGAAKALIKAKGWEKTILITDSMSAGGMPEGEYKLGEFPVIVKDGAARLISGNLAGSVLDLMTAVKNVVNWGIAPLEIAVRMATQVPAESIGMGDQVGTIEAGRVADFIVIDENLDLQATYMAGQAVYER
jgi:N-acetylglucosamine-6-phosphate deacetylase